MLLNMMRTSLKMMGMKPTGKREAQHRADEKERNCSPAEAVCENTGAAPQPISPTRPSSPDDQAPDALRDSEDVDNAHNAFCDDVDALRGEVARLRAQLEHERQAREQLEQQQHRLSPSSRHVHLRVDLREVDGDGGDFLDHRHAARESKRALKQHKAKGLLTAADSFKLGTAAVPGSKDRTWHFRSRRSQEKLLRVGRSEGSRRRRGQPAVARDNGDIVFSPRPALSPNPKKCFF